MSDYFSEETRSIRDLSTRVSANASANADLARAVAVTRMEVSGMRAELVSMHSDMRDFFSDTQKMSDVSRAIHTRHTLKQRFSNAAEIPIEELAALQSTFFNRVNREMSDMSSAVVKSEVQKRPVATKLNLGLVFSGLACAMIGEKVGLEEAQYTRFMLISYLGMGAMAYNGFRNKQKEKKTPAFIPKYSPEQIDSHFQDSVVGFYTDIVKLYDLQPKAQ